MKTTRISIIALILIATFIGCAGRELAPEPIQQTLKLEVEVITKDGQPVSYQVKEGNKVLKSMEVRKDGYQLSQISAIYEKKLYIKIFSGLSVSDVTRAWTDILIAVKEHGFKKGDEVNLYINSPGGDAFSGLALADLIESYQKNFGLKFIAHGMGIIASAAVPIFAVCDETHATRATVFMVHEAALWKWPGRETASDIRSQGRLMDLLQRLYMDKLVRNSKLTLTQWKVLESDTSWFSVEKAKEMGILDYIDN